MPIVAHAAASGSALVLVPSEREAVALAKRLRRQGVRVALWPDDWAAAAEGAVVVGTRSAAFAPLSRPSSIVVLDEHDESYKETATPAWNARDVAVERSHRLGIPCVLVSATPSLDALSAGRLVTLERSVERSSWPAVVVVDRNQEEPGRRPLFSSEFARSLSIPGRIVCVLNRTGRSRLLACRRCRGIARCGECGVSVGRLDGEDLDCRSCGASRPPVCLECGSLGGFKNLRLGVSRARDELEALAGEPVGEVTGSSDEIGAERILIGTEAVLQRVDAASVVAFLDLDQELLAPRFRAAEEALVLLGRAARLLARGGSLEEVRPLLILQTSCPEHEVIGAAVAGDPGLVAEAESERRRRLGFPPERALVVVSGAGAEEFLAGIAGTLPNSIELLGPDEAGRTLLRSSELGELLDVLGAAQRPGARLRLEVDPIRL